MSDREIRLLEENDALRQRVAELEALTFNRFEFPEAWGLKKTGTRLLSALMRVEFLTHEQAMTALYPDGERTGNAVGQQVHLLRKKLAGRAGLLIENLHGVGYRLSEPAKAKLRRLATATDLS
jgi:DNA-binding response OmpR family regulator